jgi:pimeloyl-ACP methyl ester carboxylesterase
MSHSPASATLPEVTHHTARVSGAELHYVTAGDSGTPVLLVHGFPESWWAFRGVIPVLAGEHRVIAVDLPGFGDSTHEPGEYTSTLAANGLQELVKQLDLGPVHLTGQDIAGPITFRFAAGRPEFVRSYAAIETGLPGFGLEMLADVTHGGTWHIGVVAALGIPELLLTGRERDFLAGYAYPAMSVNTRAITEQDIDEFTRAYAQPHGFIGATGLYRSMLQEGEEIRQIVTAGKLKMPVLAVGAGTGPFTYETMSQVAENVTEATLTGIGHYAALEDPEALAQILLDFYRVIDV